MHHHHSYTSVIAVLRCFLSPLSPGGGFGGGSSSGASTTSVTAYAWDDWSVVLCARWFLWPAALLQEAANTTAAFAAAAAAATTTTTTTTTTATTNDAADNNTSASPFDGPASDAGIVQYLWGAVVFVLANQVRFQWGDAALLALANTDWSGARLWRRIEAAALAVVVPVLLWTSPVSSVVTFGELRCVRACDCRGVRYDTCAHPALRRLLLPAGALLLLRACVHLRASSCLRGSGSSGGPSDTSLSRLLLLCRSWGCLSPTTQHSFIC